MRILGIECSAQAASAAVLEEDKLLGEFYTNGKMAHSQTLLPAVHALLEQLNLKLSEIDLFAVSHGPGSFTGLRIGISAVKGIAFALQKNVLGVSTLEAAAFGAGAAEGILCPVMDARCNQVYTALFEARDGKLIRLQEDAALTLQQLSERLQKIKKPIFLMGDGALLCKQTIGECADLRLVSPAVRFQRACGVCLAAAEMLRRGEQSYPADELIPQYLRLPQAERERLARQEKK